MYTMKTFDGRFQGMYQNNLIRNPYRELSGLWTHMKNHQGSRHPYLLLFCFVNKTFDVYSTNTTQKLLLCNWRHCSVVIFWAWEKVPFSSWEQRIFPRSKCSNVSMPFNYTTKAFALCGVAIFFGLTWQTIWKRLEKFLRGRDPNPSRKIIVPPKDKIPSYIPFFCTWHFIEKVKNIFILPDQTQVKNY